MFYTTTTLTKQLHPNFTSDKSLKLVCTSLFLVWHEDTVKGYSEDSDMRKGKQ